MFHILYGKQITITTKIKISYDIAYIERPRKIKKKNPKRKSFSSICLNEITLIFRSLEFIIFYQKFIFIHVYCTHTRTPNYKFWKTQKILFFFHSFQWLVTLNLIRTSSLLIVTFANSLIIDNFLRHFKTCCHIYGIFQNNGLFASLFQWRR